MRSISLTIAGYDKKDEAAWRLDVLLYERFDSIDIVLVLALPDTRNYTCDESALSHIYD